MADPRGYTKKESRKARQLVNGTESVQTEILDGDNTVEIIMFSISAEKVTFQGSGDLAGTVEFSVDGNTFYNSTAIPGSGAPATYTTHMVRVVKVTRSGGSGKVTLVAK